MSNAEEKWSWVDEDPIEKLLHAPQVSRLPELPPEPAHLPEPSPEPAHLPEPSPAAKYLAAGYEQFGQLRFEEAAGSYSEAVAADPEHPTAHFDLAVCLEKIEQWKAAVDSFRRALEIDPSRTEAYIGLGSCLLHLDGAVEALEWFERSLQAGGGEAALLGKAVALQQLHRDDEADAVYHEILETNPTWAEPLANQIALSIAREDTAAVYEYSRRLLRVHPQSKAALQGLATLALRNGDQAAAVQYCTRLVEVDPDSFAGWFNLRYAQQRLSPPQESSARSIA
jgi:Tfp pilus assembly protein PilF